MGLETERTLLPPPLYSDAFEDYLQNSVAERTATTRCLCWEGERNPFFFLFPAVCSSFLSSRDTRNATAAKAVGLLEDRSRQRCFPAGWGWTHSHSSTRTPRRDAPRPAIPTAAPEPPALLLGAGHHQLLQLAPLMGILGTAGNASSSSDAAVASVLPWEPPRLLEQSWWPWLPKRLEATTAFMAACRQSVMASVGMMHTHTWFNPQAAPAQHFVAQSRDCSAPASAAHGWDKFCARGGKWEESVRFYLQFPPGVKFLQLLLCAVHVGKLGCFSSHPGMLQSLVDRQSLLGIQDDQFSDLRPISTCKNKTPRWSFVECPPCPPLCNALGGLTASRLQGIQMHRSREALTVTPLHLALFDSCLCHSYTRSTRFAQPQALP